MPKSKLVTCSACSKEISAKAPNCPHCGEPAKPKRKGYGCLILASVAMILMVYGYTTADHTPTPSQTTEPRAPAKVVENNHWDNSVLQVKKHLARTLKDPKSVEYIGWSAVEELEDGSFRVQVQYRAKNSFGGYVIEHQLFQLNEHGHVTGVQSLTD